VGKVVLSGYFGFNNLGDEAVLCGMVQGIRREIEGTDIIVLSNAPEETAVNLRVQAVNRWNPVQVLSAIRQSDVLVSGGGSLLQDVTGVKSLYYYLGIITLAKRLGKRVMVFAQGMGPLLRDSSQRNTARILNRVDAITVRDEDSYALLCSIGVKNEVTVTADPVLGLTGSTAAQGLSEKYGLTQGRYILVSPRRWKEDNHVAPLVQALRDLQDEGWDICLFPFHKPEDTQLCREIARQLTGEVRLLEEPLSMNVIRSIFSGAVMVLGMRLHSLIFAAAGNTPMVGISYDPKVDAFLQRVEQPNAGAAGTLSGDILMASCRQVIEAAPRYRRLLAKRQQELALMVQENYRQLAELVK